MQSSKKPIKLYTLDTETRGFFGKVFRVGLYDGESYYRSSNFDDIMEVLREEAQNFDVHIYVHNLDFDISKVASNIFNQSSINFNKSIFINGNVVTLVCDLFTLHDSFRLLPSSLDKLSKSFKLEQNAKMDLSEYIKQLGFAEYKKDGKFNKEKSLENFFMNIDPEDEVLNEYLFLDCKSLHIILNMVCELAGCTPEQLCHCPTTPSLAMFVFKTYYNEDYKNSIKTIYSGEMGKFLEEFIRCGYYGGRVEVFLPFMRKGFHYDINSLYPFVMKTFKFPVGDAEYSQGVGAVARWKFWNTTHKGGGFLHCKIYVPEMHIPPLPKHDYTGKLLFPIGHLEGVWTFPEIAEALRVGCVIEEITQCVYFEQMMNIFEAFIKHFEAIKTTSEGAKREFAKLMQNSLYGKYGMNRTRVAFANIEKLEELEEKQEKFIIHRHNKNMIDIEFIECLAHSRAQYIQPQIAAYVTSLARIVLYRGLLKQQEQGEDGYCDTDSIACESPMSDDMVHDTEYGKFKLEGIIDEGIFLQPKFYAEKYTNGKQTIKAKGIPRSVMEDFDYSSYEAWLEVMREGKQTEIVIFGNVKSRRKFLGALKNNEDFDKPVILSKRINLALEQKRIIDYVGNKTYPHVRNDYGDNKDDYNNDVFQQCMDNLFNSRDTDDVIRVMCKEVGFIRTIKPDNNFYGLYEKLDEKTRHKYFRQNGTDIVTWCLNTGWEVLALLDEMEEVQKDERKRRTHRTGKGNTRLYY